MSDVNAIVARLESEVSHLKEQVVFQVHLERELKPIREAQIKQGEAMIRLAEDVGRMARAQEALATQNGETSRQVQGVIATFDKSILDAQKEKTENAKAVGGWPLVTKIFLCLSAFVAFCTILGIGYGVASLIHAAARH
jgi:hypothetical protein